jgi:hypothetical protein
MIRHTLTGYVLEDTGERDWLGIPVKRKSWNQKAKLPRWLYILIWLFCILTAPMAIIAPIVVGIVIVVACSEDSAHFVYTNKFIEWLKKEV